MREERLNVTTDDVNHYIAQAQQLRSRELAKISGQFFKLPQSLISAISGSTKNSRKAIN